MTTINTNVSSITAQAALRNSRMSTEKAMERLSTGHHRLPIERKAEA